MNLNSVSSTFLLIAFFVYLVAFLLFVLSITGKKWSNRDPEKHQKQWGFVAYLTAVLGFACQVTFFFTRWAEAGHIPTSNMYEFMTFLGMMIMFAFLIVYLIYRTPVLGIFALPIGFIIIAYASVFPSEVQPLIPALQSYWLKIHVTTAAAGEAFFGVGFAGGLMYLLRAVDYKGTSETDKREQRGVELTLFFILMLVAFIASIFTFNGSGYKAVFAKEVVVVDAQGQQQTNTTNETYVLPPIVQPYDTKVVEMKPFLGMTEPLFTAPSWMEGASAGRKLNTVIWSVLGGLVLYVLARLVARKPLGAAIGPVVKGMDPEDLDEISYRAIAIGYPIFTLGALIFAMIWAQEAWGRFWGWDPKEVWALITWLFYAVFLHLRLSKGWQGKKSAWLTVIGFIVVMFTLVGVNLVIAGLHSYAGV
ncbi:cytochrome c biogenesis protein CcsA [Paenibacillus sp. GCM10023248]|uniref:cytochrome c biogenesis protein CcsA n=1 Tax=Bacillales TaxID=1385 RepID=UPI0023792F69|nr:MULTISPECIES: cytochrome c biogenesis protein CcsA [Bacillales]MDD9267596.1 cytochrome c biogenesis protein CcsA [Paenibacillus sp. MAHUQ-63]MDR6884408.1 ABC-type transport system involved in cytochrome c biogenesis permease subunit [Bacillus sp. 3255]